MHFITAIMFDKCLANLDYFLQYCLEFTKSLSYHIHEDNYINLEN